MNKKQFDKNIAFLKENGISLSYTPVWEDKPFSVELETSSPAGEDMIIDLEKPTQEELQRYIDDFDIDEKVSIWWPNGCKMEDKGLPFNSMSEQIDDYKEYLEWLQEICDRWPDAKGKVHPKKKDLTAKLNTLREKTIEEITALVKQAPDKKIVFRTMDEEHSDETVHYGLNVGEKDQDGYYPTVAAVRIDLGDNLIIDTENSYENRDYCTDELSTDELVDIYDGCFDILYPSIPKF